MNLSSQPIGIAQYPALLLIKEGENNEPFVNLQSSPVPWEFDERFQDMASVLPGQIIIRKSVRSLLEQAQENLRKTRPDNRLLVTYGFRTLEIQTRMFLRFLVEECAEFVPDPVKLYDKVHKKVAVPTVAGHPTGGAVDVTLVDALGQRLDMGCPIYDFDGAYETFDPSVRGIAKDNRMLLRDCMLRVGFAPFDGEYWHFSYGDREWAFLTGAPASLYNQKTLQEAKEMLVAS